MFLNQDSSCTLEARLKSTAAVSQVEISVTYKDNTDSYHTDAVVATNDTTPVTLLSAPSGEVVNIIGLIKIHNPDTQANTVEILSNSTVIFTCTVGANQSAIISQDGVDNETGYIPADEDLSNLTSAGKSVASNMAMPSNNHIDISVTSTGDTYTAPADGWIEFGRRFDSEGGYMQIHDITTNFKIQTDNNTTLEYRIIYLPVRKNDTVGFYYFNGTLYRARFSYAEGSKP